MAYPYTPPMQNKFITVEMADIHAPGSSWVRPGFRGKIKNLYLVTDAAVTVATTAVKLQIGGVDVTGSTISVTVAGSGIGTSYKATPTGANTFYDTQAIEIESDGAGTGPAKGYFTLELEPV